MLKLLLFLNALLLIPFQAIAYNSSYDLIQWEPRGGDKEYCIDITDDKFNIYPGFQAIACGKNMYEFSPRRYVEEILKISIPNGLNFYWRVWSPTGYGGNGFEGKVTVGADCGMPYSSDSEKIQWGCRFKDTNYCIDIFDKDWKPIKKPFVCGENMHNFEPQRLKELNLPSGKYHWKVWSAHAYNYDSYQKFFEGAFKYNASFEF